jgi:hypothetical protein
MHRALSSRRQPSAQAEPPPHHATHDNSVVASPSHFYPLFSTSIDQFSTYFRQLLIDIRQIFDHVQPNIDRFGLFLFKFDLLSIVP